MVATRTERTDPTCVRTKDNDDDDEGYEDYDYKTGHKR